MRSRTEERLLHLAHLPHQLVIRRRKAATRSRLRVIALLLVAATIVLVAYIFAMRIQPRLWPIAVVGSLLVLALAERVWHFNSVSQSDEVYRFDRGGDRVERNGEGIARMSDVKHILVRRIRPENDDLIEADVALVIALDDTRRFTIAESMGIKESRPEIVQAASELAEYVGVEVKEDWRTSSEWWLDR